MTDVRPAAVARTFYPGNRDSLRELVESMVDKIEVPEDDELARAYVVPHAGYRFSGPTAAQVYARLRRHAAKVNRIVLVGPSHFVPLRGLAGSPATRWLTPLGAVTTVPAPGLPADAAVHEREHCLEVQLPFLQVCVGDVEVVPVAVGKSTIEEVATAINELMDDTSLLLCSTDLSHYHDETTAKKLDRATADAVLAAEPRRIKTADACGVFALRGSVAWAAHHGLSARELELSTSADTAGTAERVVGYPAFSWA